MSKSEYREWFERHMVDCVGCYTGPELPGFPYKPNDIIHVSCMDSAAMAFKYAKADAQDRQRVAV